MFFKTRLEKYIALRSTAVLFLMSLAALLFMQHKVIVLAGILLGSFLSCVRFHTLVAAFCTILDGKTASPVFRVCLFYVVGLIIIVPVFVLTILYNVDLFLGLAAGLLLIPLTIMFLGILGKIGPNITVSD